METAADSGELGASKLKLACGPSKLAGWKAGWGWGRIVFKHGSKTAEKEEVGASGCERGLVTKPGQHMGTTEGPMCSVYVTD